MMWKGRRSGSVPQYNLGTRGFKNEGLRTRRASLQGGRKTMRQKRGEENSAESVDATTYGVLVNTPTLCVVPSAGFVTTRSSTRASLVIALPFAAAASVFSARIC